MSGAHPVAPAQAWAATQQPGPPLRWKELELAAYAAHPRVRRAMGERVAINPLAVVLVGLAAVVALLVWLYPVAGIATVSQGRVPTTATPEASTRVAGAGLVFAVGAAVHLVSLVVWWLTSRHRSGAFLLQGWVAIVLGLATLLAMYAQRTEYAGWAPWAVPVTVSVLLGVAAVVANAVLPAPPRPTPGTPRAAAIREAGRLAPRQQQAVRDDLHAAVTDLAARGVVTGEERARAVEAPLGALTVAVHS